MNESEKRAQLIDCGDWTVLYIDGKKVAENHSLSPQDVLTAVGITVEPTLYYSYKEFCEMGGQFPELASDLPPATVG